jgi:hypothetical protein
MIPSLSFRPRPARLFRAAPRRTGDPPALADQRDSGLPGLSGDIRRGLSERLDAGIPAILEDLNGAK